MVLLLKDIRKWLAARKKGSLGISVCAPTGGVHTLEYYSACHRFRIFHIAEERREMSGPGSYVWLYTGPRIPGKRNAGMGDRVKYEQGHC